MKKILSITTFFILFNLLSFGQNFPGYDIQLLLNKEIKVLKKDTSLQKYGYDNFYINSSLKKKYACCESYNSKYLNLVGKIFKVVNYESYKNIIGDDKFKLLITNTEIGDIYFDYDPKYDFNFPFEVIGGLTLPDDFYCKKIKIIVDKFNGDTTYKVDIKNVNLIKKVKNNVQIIYLNIRVTGSTLNINKKGLILLLENNNRIEKINAKIDVEASEYGWVYSAFVRLTSEDITLLSNNIITDARLYIYDTDLKNLGKEFQGYLKCLINNSPRR